MPSTLDHRKYGPSSVRLSRPGSAGDASLNRVCTERNAARRGSLRHSGVLQPEACASAYSELSRRTLSKPSATTDPRDGAAGCITSRSYIRTPPIVESPHAHEHEVGDSRRRDQVADERADRPERSATPGVAYAARRAGHNRGDRREDQQVQQPRSAAHSTVA
jgi:hypothetical protein